MKYFKFETDAGKGWREAKEWVRGELRQQGTESLGDDDSD